MGNSIVTKIASKIKGRARQIKSWRNFLPWPPTVLKLVVRDHCRHLPTDPGALLAIDAGLDWLLEAQSMSSSHDGGVARHYSPKTGWAASYPETTGYIIPTLLEHSTRRKDVDLRVPAQKMLDWLKSIQMPSGAYHGGHRHSPNLVPVVFDTGQILFGLAAGVREFGEHYASPLKQAADWLVNSQDDDGVWRIPNPFAVSGDHLWETHVAWGLLEAAKVTGSEVYATAGMKNIRWAASQQHTNGWYPNCGLGRRDLEAPLTHCIGYTLRGILEGYRFSHEASLLDAGITTADALLRVQQENGSIPGQLDKNWHPTVNWVCLTGCVQIALCWFLLFRETGRQDYLNAARKANAFVRRTILFDAPQSVRGAVKGSYPISGNYCSYQYINWACKFMIDANTLEIALREDPTPYSS